MMLDGQTLVTLKYLITKLMPTVDIQCCKCNIHLESPINFPSKNDT